MAGRGRGRGFRMSFSFDSERRENPQQQTSNQQPNPLYPVMSQRPLPLLGGDSVEYLLALKQELRGAARSSNTYITPEVKRKDIQRYSDKYQQDQDQDQDYRPDWSMFPKELRVRSQKPRPSGVKVKAVSGQTVKKLSSKTEKTELLLKLESLEQKENVTDPEEEEEEEKKAEEEEAEEEQLDEDEFEEETDYIMSYFDNGEEFGADSDDNMDEAIY